MAPIIQVDTCKSNMKLEVSMTISIDVLRSRLYQVMYMYEVSTWDAIFAFFLVAFGYRCRTWAKHVVGTIT